MPNAPLKPAKEADFPSEEFHFKQPGEDPEYDAWFSKQVQIGLDQIARGEIVPDETVQAEWRQRRAELLRLSDESK